MGAELNFLFNDFIRSNNLTELHIKGRKYSWSNMQEDPLFEQLDWFLPLYIGQPPTPLPL
jgi:hypothetical protein